MVANVQHNTRQLQNQQHAPAVLLAHQHQDQQLMCHSHAMQQHHQQHEQPLQQHPQQHQQQQHQQQPLHEDVKVVTASLTVQEEVAAEYDVLLDRQAAQMVEKVDEVARLKKVVENLRGESQRECVCCVRSTTCFSLVNAIFKYNKERGSRAAAGLSGEWPRNRWCGVFEKGV